MSGPTDADRAKAAEPLTALEWLRVTHADTLSGRRVEEAIAAERGETEALIRRAETAEAALSVARRGWDAERAAVADLRARVRDWIGDVAFRPNDIVLGQTAVTADQLPDLHRLLDALDPEWRDWTDGAKRDRRAAVTDTTGGVQ